MQREELKDEKRIIIQEEQAGGGSVGVGGNYIQA